MFVCLGGGAQSYAQSLRVSWDPSPDPDAAGYNVYLGQDPSSLVLVRDVGTGLSWEQSVSSYGQWCAGIKSYDAGAHQGPFSEIVCTTIPEPPPPPPPPPPPAQCLTFGTGYAPGDRLAWSGKHGEADPFIAERSAEGWVLISRSKVRNITTLVLECRAQ